MSIAPACTPRLLPVALVLYLGLAAPMTAIHQSGKALTEAARAAVTAVPCTLLAGLGNESFEAVGGYTDRPLLLPRRCGLERVSPAAARTTATIDYTVGAGGHPVDVTLEIYDMHGTRVRTLLDDVGHRPGQYSFFWRGTDGSGARLGAGTYFCRMRAGGFLSTRKVVIAE